MALHYKGKAVDIQKTGDALRVQTLLTGRVAQHGDNLSVGVELADVRNGKQLWGQQYSGKVGDLLSLESDIATEVSKRLRSDHSPGPQKLAPGSTENPDAYQLYLKGQHYTSKFTKDGFDKGMGYLNQAIAIDPNYAWPTALLLITTSIRSIGLWRRRSPHQRPKKPPKRRWNWTRATRKRMSCWASNCSGTSGTGWARSESSNARLTSIRIAPKRSATIHGSCRSWVAAMKQSPKLGVDCKTDPLSTGLNGNLGSIYIFTHQWDKAIEQLRSSIDLDPNYWFDHYFLGRAYEQKGRFPEAIGALKQAISLGGTTEVWSSLGHAYAMSGQRKEAQQVIEYLQDPRFTHMSLPTISPLFMPVLKKG